VARACVSGQVDDVQVHEHGEDVGSSDSGGEIPAAVDLPAGPAAGRVGGAGVYTELTSRTLSIAIILKDLLIFIKSYRKRDTFFF
jgi:hypothetical protein